MDIRQQILESGTQRVQRVRKRIWGGILEGVRLARVAAEVSAVGALRPLAALCAWAGAAGLCAVRSWLAAWGGVCLVVCGVSAPFAPGTCFWPGAVDELIVPLERAPEPGGPTELELVQTEGQLGPGPQRERAEPEFGL